MPGLLDNINLPPEDADKPAELDWKVGGDDTNKPQDTTENAKPEDNKPTKESLGDYEGSDRDKPEDKKDEIVDGKKDSADTSTETPENKDKKKDVHPNEDKDKDEETKPAPFHEHPDWKKSQEEKRQLEIEKAKLEGKLEAMEKRGDISEDKKEEIKSAAQIAEEAINKKLEEGWKPKDAIEVNRAYGEALERALDAKQAAKEKAANEEQSRLKDEQQKIYDQMDGIYKELGVETQADQDKIAALANKWIQEGKVNRNIGALQLAGDYLKAKGEIGKATEVKVNPKPIVDNNEENKKREETNRRISRPTGEGGSGKPQTRSIKELRSKDLDQIVLEQAEALG